MRRGHWLAAAVMLAVAAAGPAWSAPVRLMDWSDLVGRPPPHASERFAYGPDPLQVAELWLPAGKGPFPAVVMIHGGCWASSIASLSLMNYAAEDLRERGIAVWNIEYRGFDRPGGGYPGTFQDAAAAADLLETVGPAHHLRMDRLVAVGHSAGGHLAAWLAARGRIAATSPLHGAHPLPIAGVVSLGGLPDLQQVHALGICGVASVEGLVGAAGAGARDLWADTSPARLGAGREPQVFIDGDQDPISPPSLDGAYVAKMRALGAHVRQVTVPHTGHVELISPGTAAWTRTVETIDDLVR